MFFSIVIPTYNRAHLIQPSIQSLLNQTFQDFEIIVVDDGSTDNTEEVIGKLNSEKITYHKTKNFGVAHARNYGIQKAKANYIGFLDSDDKVKPEHLQTAFNYLNQNPKTQILHLNFDWIKLNGEKNRNKLPKRLPNDIFKGNSLHVNCVFVNNELAKQNLFNENQDLMFSEDWDFFIKLCVKYSVKLINAPTVFLIDHEERSMRNFNLPVWEKRRDALVQSLTADEIVYKKFPEKIKNVSTRMDSLIALNCMLSKNKKQGIVFFMKSVFENPAELFNRRTLAIFKHLLIS